MATSTKEAFIQTDGAGCGGGVGYGGGAGCDADIIGKLFGNIDFKDVCKIVNDDLEKQFCKFNQPCKVKFGLGTSGDLGEMCGLSSGLGVVGGGTGVALFSSVIGYICFISLLFLCVVCLLGYIFYLKYHNNCENKQCCFNIESNFVEQIKKDTLKGVKDITSTILKHSISIIKSITKTIQVSNDIYEKSVSELLLHIEA